ncbi:unnamed protein product [Leptosia nina]|uniref:Pro-corazonin n=1 Tax=Leptosia nina TaxID=320188 RepID=A0AAV1IV46_9NEOP
MTNITLIIIAVTLTTVAAQTFQYSRGWTNGKRDHKRNEQDNRNLDRILTPCQLQKLKYLLQGKPFSERLMIPCEYVNEDTDQLKQYQYREPDALIETFQ